MEWEADKRYMYRMHTLLSVAPAVERARPALLKSFRFAG